MSQAPLMQLRTRRMAGCLRLCLGRRTQRYISTPIKNLAHVRMELDALHVPRLRPHFRERTVVIDVLNRGVLYTPPDPHCPEPCVRVPIGIDRSVPADAADLVYYAAFAVSFVCADDYTILRSVEVLEFRPIITFAGHRGSRRHSSSLRQAPKRGILLRVGAPEERVEPGVEPWAIGHQLCHWYARSIQCTLLTNEWSFAESRIPIKPMTPMPLVSSSELISVHHRQGRRTQSEPRNRNRNRLNVNCHHAYVFPVAQPASDSARIVILRHHPAALQRQA